jgi:hypothetical protein
MYLFYILSSCFFIPIKIAPFHMYNSMRLIHPPPKQLLIEQMKATHTQSEMNGLERLLCASNMRKGVYPFSNEEFVRWGMTDLTQTSIESFIFFLVVSIAYIFRNGEFCKTDMDCPSVMKCCVIGNDRYCCTPNNYIKLEFSYIYNFIPPIPDENRNSTITHLY